MVRRWGETVRATTSLGLRPFVYRVHKVNTTPEGPIGVTEGRKGKFSRYGSAETERLAWPMSAPGQ